MSESMLSAPEPEESRTEPEESRTEEPRWDRVEGKWKMWKKERWPLTGGFYRPLVKPVTIVKSRIPNMSEGERNLDTERQAGAAVKIENFSSTTDTLDELKQARLFHKDYLAMEKFR